jgi:hypothetical protein
MHGWSFLSYREWWAVVAVIFLVTALIVGLRYTQFYAEWRRWRIARSITTPLGNVRVTQRDIRKWSWRAYPHIVENHLPDHVQLVLRKQTAGDLGRACFELIDPDKARNSVELKRAMTVAAALYNFQLPWRLVLLDEITAAYLQCALYDLETVYVDPSSLENVVDYHVAESVTLTNLGVSRYTSKLSLVGGVLLILANNPHYPAMKSFVKVFNQNLKKDLRNTFTEDEVRSMVTAYSVLTSTRIPRSYILLDAVTKAIIANPTPASRPVPKEVIPS